MDGDLEKLAKVCLWVAASMTYARFASSKIPPGKLRLLALLPVLCLLPCLPWSFSSIQLRSIAAFFLAWLALFKLLLLSFGLGPLYPSLPLFLFLSSASLPVKLLTNSKPKPSPSLSGHRLLFSAVLRPPRPVHARRRSCGPERPGAGGADHDRVRRRHGVLALLSASAEGRT